MGRMMRVDPHWDRLPCASPARTGSLEGPDFPSEGRYLPYLASFQVKIAIVRQNCAKLCKLRGSPPQI